MYIITTRIIHTGYNILQQFGMFSDCIIKLLMNTVINEVPCLHVWLGQLSVPSLVCMYQVHKICYVNKTTLLLQVPFTILQVSAVL